MANSKCSQLGGASIVSVSVGQVAAPRAFITPHDSHAPPVGGGRLNRLTPVRRKRSRVRANKRAAFAPTKAKKLARGAEFVRTSARLSLQRRQRSWQEEPSSCEQAHGFRSKEVGTKKAAPAPAPRLRPAPASRARTAPRACAQRRAPRQRPRRACLRACAQRCAAAHQPSSSLPPSPNPLRWGASPRAPKGV